MDAQQQDRLSRLAARGRVSSTTPSASPSLAATSSPAPVTARAAAPLPPPDPRFIIESDPLTAVLPLAGRAHLAPPLAKASKRVTARDIIGAMPAGIERKGRRKHAAIAGRIVVVGMTTSAFLGGLAALASAPPPAPAAAPQPPPQPVAVPAPPPASPMSSANALFGR